MFWGLRKKRKEIQEEYNKLGLKIRPLVLIQFPNGSEEWIERVKDALSNLGYGETSGLVASWFSGEHPDNPEEITKLDGQYSFLLFKQAIATGWDCPRAKILIKPEEKNFLVLYLLEPIGENENKIYDFASKNNLQVVKIWRSRIVDQSGNDLRIIGPEEWLGYMKYAKCIVTNSFHGICFSIIFKY